MRTSQTVPTLALGSATIAALLISQVVVEVLRPTGITPGLVGGPVLVLLLLTVMLRRPVHVARRCHRAIIAQSGVALLLGTVLAAATGTVTGTHVFPLLIPAACEEIVFRGILPRAFARSMPGGSARPRNLWIGCLAAQALFALCHLQQPVLWAQGSYQVAYLVQLTANGLLLFAVVRVAGIGVAAALHASYNGFLASDATAFLRIPLSFWVIAFVTAALLLWIKSEVTRRPGSLIVHATYRRQA